MLFIDSFDESLSRLSQSWAAKRFGATRKHGCKFASMCVLDCVWLTCACVCSRGRGGDRLPLYTIGAVQQLANKDGFCSVWQRFAVHYFPLCPARIPDLSSCSSCKDTLSGPDSSSHARTHAVRMPHTHLSSQSHICGEHM